MEYGSQPRRRSIPNLDRFLNPREGVPAEPREVERYGAPWPYTSRMVKATLKQNLDRPVVVFAAMVAIELALEECSVFPPIQLTITQRPLRTRNANDVIQEILALSYSYIAATDEEERNTVSREAEDFWSENVQGILATLLEENPRCQSLLARAGVKLARMVAKHRPEAFFRSREGAPDALNDGLEVIADAFLAYHRASNDTVPYSRSFEFGDRWRNEFTARFAVDRAGEAVLGPPSHGSPQKTVLSLNVFELAALLDSIESVMDIDHPDVAALFDGIESMMMDFEAAQPAPFLPLDIDEESRHLLAQQEAERRRRVTLDFELEPWAFDYVVGAVTEYCSRLPEDCDRTSLFEKVMRAAMSPRGFGVGRFPRSYW